MAPWKDREDQIGDPVKFTEGIRFTETTSKTLTQQASELQ